MRLGTESDNYVVFASYFAVWTIIFCWIKKIKGYVSLREEQEKSICGQAPTFF